MDLGVIMEKKPRATPRERANAHLTMMLIDCDIANDFAPSVTGDRAEKLVSLIIQAAVDQMRAELLDHRQKGDEIAKHHRETAFAYSVSDRVAYAVNKFIEKGVENDK